MKFFSSIFIKNKKVVCLIILFFIISGLIIPNTSLAVSKWWLICPACYIGQSIYEKGLSESGKDLTNAILVGVGTILTSITGGLRDIAKEFLDVVINKNNFPSYTGTDNPIVSVGWTASRDLANMFIVLGFVIIGIATTLRIQEYQAKKALFPLIIAALLINFSLLITGIFIDASNITMDYFLKSSGHAVQTSMFKSVEDQFNALNIAYSEGVEPAKILAMVAGLVFYNIMSFIIFILFAFLFVFRHIALWILVMLSPLAFVFYVFPFTKKFFEMWWSNFFGWCIIGIPAAFTLYLADKLTVSLINEKSGYLAFFVPGLFLIAGFLFSLQTSAMGASMTIGAFKKTGKFTGKFTGDRLKESRAGQWVGSKVGGAMERLKLRQTGTTATANTKQVEDKAKLLSNEYAAAKATGNTGTVERIQKLARTGKGAEGAAAMKVVTDAKDLHKTFKTPTGGVDLATASARLNYAESVGAKDIIKDSEKRMPGLAAHNRVTTKELEGTINPATGVNYTPLEAPREAIRKKNADMSPSDMKDLHESQIDINHLKDVRYKTFSRASLDYNADQIAKAKTLRPELEDIKYSILGVPGATPAARATAYKTMSKANRFTLKNRLSAQQKNEIDDLSRKAVAIKRL